MKQRIFRAMLLLAVVTLLAGSLLSGVVTHAVLTARVHEEVRSEAKTLALLLSQGGDEALLRKISQINPATRLTLIASDGTVRFDSVADFSKMENHSNRPEIQMAQTAGAGAELRESGTVGSKTFYYALRLADGEYLRIAATSESVWGIFLKQAGWLLLAMIPVILFAAALAKRQTGLILSPMLRLDLEHPKDNDVYEELSPLLLRMEHQRLEIAAQLDRLARKQREFSDITDNMREGLAVLDGNLQLLSLNHSAANLFGVQAEAVRGRYFLTLNRSEPLRDMLTQAVQKGEAGSTELLLGGRYYQLAANPVSQEGEHAGGVVLLAIDITEQKQAETLRREFTANVSHELKTPLTSISGYAEMIESGLVKPEDVRPFSGRIHTEALRLIQLVEDLLALSQLDEQATLPNSQSVPLKELVTRIAQRLEPMTQKQGVQISVLGEEHTVMGDPRLLDELVQNLCENAVKYNREGGSVELLIQREKQQVCLTVTDTGVGIAKEHLARVFERFYRIDKSRSKETGGTGLGLSIVKHIAHLHRAAVSLKSEEGKGTSVSVLFPMEK